MGKGEIMRHFVLSNVEGRSGVGPTGIRASSGFLGALRAVAAPFAVFVAAALFALPGSAAVMLDQNCVVSVLNRNTNVNPDGSWVLPNVPANFGLVRARATCVNNGVTTAGQSDPFSLGANQTVNLPHIPLGNTTPIPNSLTLTAPNTNLTNVGQSVQMTATATFTGAPSRNVTAASSGITYRSTNNQIASVTVDGLIIAGNTSGTAIIQASLEGTQGVISFSVVPLGSSHGGIPDTWAVDHGLDPNDPTMPQQDPDHDGATNLEEFQKGTDPHNPDTDGDGLSDGDEIHGTHLVNGVERNPNHYTSNPVLADTDGDGIPDAVEIMTSTNPGNAASFNLTAAMTSMDVAPGNFTLIVNALSGIASVQLTVTGHLIDGHSTIDLTSTTRGTNYSSTDLGVCNFGSPDGRVFAGSNGACDITIRNGTFTAVSHGAVTNFTPVNLSFVSVPGFANAVALSGDFAFIAAGGSGLQVVSLSADRTTPTVTASLSLPGSSYDVFVSGATAYVVGSSNLSVVDITNPAVPVLRGTFNSGNCLGVAVQGSTAFLNCNGGLLAVNVANPAAMIQVSSLSVGGTSWKIALDSGRHFVAMAMGSAGLKLVDVTNPASPVLKGTAATGDTRGVALNGNWAFVADYGSSTNAVDTTSLTAPVIRSNITNQSLGGRLQDIALGSSFAFGADVVFVNGVPITDITDPTQLQARSILNFTQRDDNGMGIAVDSSFVYLVTEHSNINRGGSSGDSRLYIGQYQPRQDLAGVAPTASITNPTNNSTQIQGLQITETVNANDDVGVAHVDFLVNGTVAFSTTIAPFQYTFTLPTGVNSVVLGARAVDFGNNIGNAANVTLNLIPDPLTVVTGLVVNAANQPINGATVIAPGGLTVLTGSNGRFSIPSVPTILGNILVSASFTPSGQPTQTGTSAALAPVRGGVTDVGTIALIPASFNQNFGTYLSNCDDCAFQRSFGFTFPFFGTNRTVGFVGTNGYITFDSGDSTYTESLPGFSDRPRISAFFDDLGPAVCNTTNPQQGVWVNDTIPNQFIVTWYRDPHYRCGAENTLQMQLYSDGRIIFAYQGVASVNTGTIVGLTPTSGANLQSIDYSTQRNVDVPAGSGMYEYFNGVTTFDLDNGFIIYTPNSGGGYNVRTLLPAVQSLGVGAVTGGPALGLAAVGPNPFANAVVTVRSSGNPQWVGMTNTDSQGHFTLAKVPAGGISVTLTRNGQVVGIGGGVFTGGTLNQLSLTITAPPAPKTAPVAH